MNDLTGSTAAVVWVPPAPAKASLKGLLADEVRSLQAAPLFSVQGFAVAGGEVVVTGLMLAPDGDAAAVALVADPGIAFSIEYPLPNPTAAEVFWYWPNAGVSAFRLRIDLAATRHVGTAYRFRIHFAGRTQDRAEELRTTILMPKDLGWMQNFPGPDSLSRVQRFNTINNVVPQAFGDAFRIVEIARQHGFDPAAGAVLDWGTGHGRVARFLGQFGVAGPVYGTDIDPQNIAWAKAHLPGITFDDGPLMPPAPYPAGRFDLVFGISVMTHLTRQVQRAWLAELHRIMRPGAVALLTFTGDSSVAYSSRYLDRAWLDEYLAEGAGRDLPSDDLKSVIAEPGYYRNVKLTAQKAAELCSEWFAVEAIHLCMFGYQDLLVLKKRPARRRAVRRPAA